MNAFIYLVVMTAVVGCIVFGVSAAVENIVKRK
jgi:hypothetical protein